MKLRRDPVRVWERFRWILKKKVKEEIVFILYSVQHMSYLYHKHHIFNIFVYNSMSTFSMRCWALDISVPLLCLFSFSSSSSFHFKTNPIMFPFSHHFSPIWIGWEDFFIAQLPQNWFQKTLWLFSKTFLSPTTLLFHQQHLSQSLSPLHVSTFTNNILVKVSPHLFFHQKCVLEILFPLHLLFHQIHFW